MRSKDRKLKRESDDARVKYEVEFQARLQDGFDHQINKLWSDGVELMVRQGLIVPTEIDYEV